MEYRVGLTDRALDDLKTIVGFIAEQNSEAAKRIGYELLDVAFTLATFPRRGTSVRKRHGLRKLSHRHWLIFYRINEIEKQVEVLRIWDGRQNPVKLRLP